MNEATQPIVDMQWDLDQQHWTVSISYSRNNEQYIKIITCLTHDEENALENK